MMSNYGVVFLVSLTGMFLSVTYGQSTNLIPGTGAGDVKLTPDASNRQDTGPLAFDGAEWIWDRDAGEQAGTRYFQKEFLFSAGEKPEKAEVIITADNQWTLYINGRKVGQHDAGADTLTYSRTTGRGYAKRMVSCRDATPDPVPGGCRFPGASG